MAATRGFLKLQEVCRRRLVIGIVVGVAGINLQLIITGPGPLARIAHIAEIIHIDARTKSPTGTCQHGANHFRVTLGLVQRMADLRLHQTG